MTGRVAPVCSIGRAGYDELRLHRLRPFAPARISVLDSSPSANRRAQGKDGAHGFFTFKSSITAVLRPGGATSSGQLRLPP